MNSHLTFDRSFLPTTLPRARIAGKCSGLLRFVAVAASCWAGAAGVAVAAPTINLNSLEYV